MVTCAVWLKTMPRPVLERPWCCLESPSVGLKYSIQLPAVQFVPTPSGKDSAPPLKDTI